ncbi:OmpA family protein [Acinetobacter sp. MD2(2019)]|uniref:OmpA family protein n=1 Tax=Acinetobacter sp. MD2(2019) TaxID=2605273 RepID=UPI002D1F8DA0|nr:OmpA family protein [Acinetobacter sp. MD2(2019)]MEB3752858.1 OmpA family protein [Acinetobacter sp. MD2(2019)]
MKKEYIVLVLAPLFLTACAGNVSHRWCPPVATVQEPAPVVYEKEAIQLSADALFKFDKSGVNDILPKGKLELDVLVDKLKKGYVAVKQINIVGHTDRLGSEQYNNKLGMARAETIRNYLVRHGIETDYNVSSQGKSDPITKDCLDTLSKEALKACLQPDRRVNLEITGIKVVEGK